jgi:branched-chain amino acid aminotransferase
MLVKDSMFNIQRCEVSRISQVNFDDLPFGRVFSDHMFIMEYADGKWSQGSIVPFQNISLNPASSVIHYGQSIFEGIKAFRNVDGRISIFRPEENIKRFNKSAERMCMPQLDKNVFLEALKQLIDVDNKWVPESMEASLYIRPFMFSTDEYIGVKPSETYRFIIFTCPVGKYYAGDVKVKVETHYARSVKGGTGFAKAAGNYAGALYPAKLAQEQGYHQLLWTDAVEHKYIEESGTMNVMFRTGNKIITPALSETILNGVTRDSVLTLARDWGYEVEERRVSVEEIRQLLKDGKLDEAFGAGTAATIAPICSIGFEDANVELPPYSGWEFAPKAAQTLIDIRRGRTNDPFNWNTYI